MQPTCTPSHHLTSHPPEHTTLSFFSHQLLSQHANIFPVPRQEILNTNILPHGFQAAQIIRSKQNTTISRSPTPSSAPRRSSLGIRLIDPHLPILLSAVDHPDMGPKSASCKRICDALQCNVYQARKIDVISVVICWIRATFNRSKRICKTRLLSFVVVNQTDR